jgi:hypothetical protein
VLSLQEQIDRSTKAKSLSLFEFQQHFATDNQCFAYLSAKKWKDGYKCRKMQTYTLLRRESTLFSSMYTVQTH